VIAGAACVAAAIARDQSRRPAKLLPPSSARKTPPMPAVSTRSTAGLRPAEHCGPGYRGPKPLSVSYRSTIQSAELMLKAMIGLNTVSRSAVGNQLELRGWEWGYLMARCP
jgi:hypothetical protein